MLLSHDILESNLKLHISSHCYSKKRQLTNVKYRSRLLCAFYFPQQRQKLSAFRTLRNITADPLKAKVILFSYQRAVCMDGKHGCQMACVWCSQEQSCLIHHIYFPFQLFLCSSQSNILCLQKSLLQTDEVKSHHTLCDDDVHPGQSTYTKKNRCKTFR